MSAHSKNPTENQGEARRELTPGAWQGSKFAVNWEAQTIVNHWIIPTPLSGFPRGLIQCQSFLRTLRQSLLQGEFSSWSHHTASWQPPIAGPLSLWCLLLIFTCSQGHNRLRKQIVAVAMGFISMQVQCFAFPSRIFPPLPRFVQIGF